MSDDEIERMARAICEELGIDPDGETGHYTSCEDVSDERQAEIEAQGDEYLGVFRVVKQWEEWTGHARFALASYRAARRIDRDR